MDALDQIALEAQGHEAEQEAAQEAALNPNPEPPVDAAAVWAQIPAMFGGMLAIAMPELKDAYNEKACYQWGGAMASVADKYGWDAAETMGRFAPEIALCVATLPLALPTIAAIKARRKEADKKDENATRKKSAEDAANVKDKDMPQGGNFDEPR